MLRDRNEISHIYDEHKARDIYNRMAGYHREMRNTLEGLKTRQTRRQSSP